MHRLIQKLWANKGIQVASEVHVQDTLTGIRGTIDSYIRTKDGYETVVDIKTRSSKALAEQKGPLDQNVSQINFYEYTLGLPEGFLHYVSRDDPSMTKTYKVKFDPARLQRDVGTIMQAKNQVQNWEKSGKINRWEFYSDIDKLRILSDTAPYSETYQAVKQKLMYQKDRLEELGEWDEVVKIIQHTKSRWRSTGSTITSTWGRRSAGRHSR